jgi:hypothetical protein
MQTRNARGVLPGMQVRVNHWLCYQIENKPLKLIKNFLSSD